jgi:site-specific DNA recombinase
MTPLPGQQVRAALYARQSKTDGLESASIEDQIEKLLALAEREEWLVTGVYTDADAPWNDLEARSDWVRLLTDAKKEHPDGGPQFHVLAAFDTSRLWRDPEMQIVTGRHLLAAGVSQIATLGGTFSTDPSANPEAAFISTLMAAVARLDQDLRRLKVKNSHYRAAEAGNVSPNSHRPWGYVDTFRSALDEEEADVIRDAARRVLDGETPGTVAAALNKAGFYTTTGRPWTGMGLRRTLLSPSLAGLRGYHRSTNGIDYEEIFDGTWPAVFDRATWERLRIRFGGRHETYHRHLLSGIAVCGRDICGAGLTGSRDKQGRRIYLCRRSDSTPKNCGRLTIRAEPLEEQIRQAVIDAAGDRDLIARYHRLASAGDQEAERAAAELQQVAKRHTELAELWASGDLPTEQWKAALRKLQDREQDAHRRLGRVRTGGLKLLMEITEDPAEWWERHPDRRREAVTALMYSIRILPYRHRTGTARAYDPLRVRPEWRF